MNLLYISNSIIKNCNLSSDSISGSKVSIGFNQERKLEKCSQNFSCPGNLIQTCGCLDKTSMYPMVVDASKLGNYFTIEMNSWY